MVYVFLSGSPTNGGFPLVSLRNPQRRATHILDPAGPIALGL